MIEGSLDAGASGGRAALVAVAAALKFAIVLATLAYASVGTTIVAVRHGRRKGT